MVYTVRFTDGALDDVRRLRAHDRSHLFDEIAEQLTHEPTVGTRRRKLLQGIDPPWDQVGPVWQLRVGDYRVFYDVLEEEKLVWVRAVRRKGSMTTDEALALEGKP